MWRAARHARTSATSRRSSTLSPRRKPASFDAARIKTSSDASLRIAGLQWDYLPETQYRLQCNTAAFQPQFFCIESLPPRRHGLECEITSVAGRLWAQSKYLMSVLVDPPRRHVSMVAIRNWPLSGPVVMMVRVPCWAPSAALIFLSSALASRTSSFYFSTKASVSLFLVAPLVLFKSV